MTKSDYEFPLPFGSRLHTWTVSLASSSRKERSMPDKKSVEHIRKSPKALVFVVFFSILIGLFSIVSAVFGLFGKGGGANVSFALPNLITGIASIAGGVACFSKRKWAIPALLIALVGHFSSHIALLISHMHQHRLSVGGVLSLSFVPIFALISLIYVVRLSANGSLE